MLFQIPDHGEHYQDLHSWQFLQVDAGLFRVE